MNYCESCPNFKDHRSSSQWIRISLHFRDTLSLPAVPAAVVEAVEESTGRLPVCNLDVANSRFSLIIMMMIRIVIIIIIGRIQIIIGIVV